ncbi:hypothetical protein U9M48_015120 [Paspalum notatum var. saurae]|uniref:15-cis-phytoene synthase n=1 Tax=Paspalum notatum var. saurae TaxID=547442 RepID=A0AAQ3WLB9_PASNO
MSATTHAVSSHSPARAARCRQQQRGRWSFLASWDGRRRGGCSVHAAGSNTIDCLEARPWGSLALPGLQVAAPAPAPGDDALAGAAPAEQRVHEVVLRQAALAAATPRTAGIEPGPMAAGELREAFDRCGEVCKEYAKTFYLATQLMTPERRRAIWAIYVWCRRTDELVDGPNASHISALALDRWESRLEDIFAGRPYDMLDAALSDTVANFPVDIQARGRHSIDASP